MILISAQEVQHIKDTLGECQQVMSEDSNTEAYSMLYDALAIMETLESEAEDMLIDDFDEWED